MATESIETAAQNTEVDVHRILVVANETVDAPELLEEIARRTKDRRAAVKVVAPTLVDSPVKYVVSEIDEARQEAQARLQRSLDAIRRLGVEASGAIGDDDPNVAIDDALRSFPADEVIISTHPPERSRWLEHKVVERAHRELSVPVTHVVIDLDAEAESERVRLVERIEPRARRRPAGEDHPDYLPPLSIRDRLTLVVGVVGTIVLCILVLTCHSDGGTFTGGCAVRWGLAMGALIVTLFHGIALLVMGSVRYRGFWRDAAADTVLLGVPAAVLVSLLVA
jgi:hypothetical protein